MPLFTKTVVAGIAALLSIPVYGSPIIGPNYSSPILTHMADIVQGANTSPVVSLNAPNWANGIPLAVPVGVAAATSTGGTLASSTTWYFEVSALDGNGTTTVSSSASGTTDNTGESLQVSWSSVTGATGYAVYISTSTPNNFTQYFLASSTNGTPNTSYTFGTSTGSLGGSYTKLDPTAFSALINPLGTSYLNGGPLQVNGGSTQTLGYFYGSTNNFSQVVVHNTNPGNNASAEFVACNNLSKVLWPLGTNCPNYYLDLGINSSAFSQAAFSGEAANDAFITSSDSNLDLETASTTGPAAINFLTAGTASTSLRMSITASGLVGIGTSTPVTTLDVASGTMRAYSISTSTCAASNDGALFYNAKDKHLYVCESATWQIIK